MNLYSWEVDCARTRRKDRPKRERACTLHLSDRSWKYSDALRFQMAWSSTIRAERTVREFGKNDRRVIKSESLNNPAEVKVLLPAVKHVAASKAIPEQMRWQSKSGH